METQSPTVLAREVGPDHPDYDMECARCNGAGCGLCANTGMMYRRWKEDADAHVRRNAA